MGGYFPVGDNGIGAVQDVEKQRLQKLRVLANLLEVEALEAGKRNRVFCVVKKKAELSTASPFCESIREVMPQSVREDSQGPKSRVHFVKIFDLVVKVPFDCGVEIHLTGALQENFQKERQKVEVLLCRWQREWIDLEIA